MFLSLLGTAASCTTLPPPAPAADPQRIWQERERRLAEVRTWSVTGRIAIRTPKESWSASLSWKQDKEAYHIRLSSPLGQGSLEIQGNAAGVMLRTSRNESYTAPDPETLLYQTTGWRFPLNSLRFWILGRTDPEMPQAEVDIDNTGKPRSLHQGGWEVEYLRYQEQEVIPLPDRLSLKNPALSARIALTRWTLESPVAPSPIPAALTDYPAPPPMGSCQGRGFFQINFLLHTLKGGDPCIQGDY